MKEALAWVTGGQRLYDEDASFRAAIDKVTLIVDEARRTMGDDEYIEFLIYLRAFAQEWTV